MLAVLTERTKIARAHSKFKGFKTTIPWSFVDDLKVEEGDYLIWEWKVLDGEMILTVRKDKTK